MHGQICYGIAFDEGYEFPWDTIPWVGDHEKWWRNVNRWDAPEYPYAKDGGYKPGFHQDDPRIREYFESRSAWDAENPFPVEIVYCGDFNSADTILAVRSSLVIAEYWETFDPSKLIIHVDEPIALLNFCRRWNIEITDPKWWLSTYQG